jgi:hypothetical protein
LLVLLLARPSTSSGHPARCVAKPRKNTFLSGKHFVPKHKKLPLLSRTESLLKDYWLYLKVKFFEILKRPNKQISLPAGRLPFLTERGSVL